MIRANTKPYFTDWSLVDVGDVIRVYSKSEDVETTVRGEVDRISAVGDTRIFHTRLGVVLLRARVGVKSDTVEMIRKKPPHMLGLFDA